LRAELQVRELPVVLSIDPGQKGGPTNSFSVIQVWAPKDGAHLLLDQWREQASYREFRSEVRLFILKYRPSVVLIEGTGQGPALSSDIKPQNGMEIVVITPSGDKVERLRKYRRIIRDGLVQLPQNAPWSHEFLNEATQFPYGPFDDQMDALSQYLNWVTEHPHPNKRPPRAIAQGVGSGGRVMDSSGHGQGTEIPGGVLRPRGRMMSNGPFQQPNVTVKY
jgi:predicted phage terminase large subunit-like protein